MMDRDSLELPRVKTGQDHRMVRIDRKMEIKIILLIQAIPLSCPVLLSISSSLGAFLRALVPSWLILAS